MLSAEPALVVQDMPHIRIAVVYALDELDFASVVLEDAHIQRQ